MAQSASSSLNNLSFRLYLKYLIQLMKPRVMSLVIFTCMVGLVIAPVKISLLNSAASLFFVAIGAGASGILNMWYDSDIDKVMTRTCLRPLPMGKFKRQDALIAGIFLSVISVVSLYYFSNLLSSFLLAFTIFFYFFIYTVWLKRSTPQNIVIGGAAGAFPPVIGWTIATNQVSIEPIILFLIIFIWTPSHFWALNLYKNADYKKAKIPMLTVLKGELITKKNILFYAVALFPITLLPFYLNFASYINFITAVVLGVYYIYLCYELLKENRKAQSNKLANKIFIFSIFYLFFIFATLLLDYYFFKI
jgi:protoheme IX farnesyltransferase